LKAYEKARLDAREGKSREVARRIPAWIEKRDGRLFLIPARAAVLRRIYELARSGYGLTSIVKALDAEGARPFGPTGAWSRGYVGLVLKDRRAMGEFQPLHKDKRPAGPPIPGYFPPAVSEADWLTARAGAAQRRRRAGRLDGKNVNIFTGLLCDAMSGKKYLVASRTNWGVNHRVIMTGESKQGRGPCRSFPLESFEEGIRRMLHEVNPGEVMPAAEGADKVDVLEGELDSVRAKIAELKGALLGRESASVVEVLIQLEERERELEAQIKAEQIRRAHPLEQAWGECRLPARTEDERLRLRAALRRIIDQIYVLVVSDGRGATAAVQVWFTGSGHRDYLLTHRRADGRATPPRKASWTARSLPAEALPREALPDGLDLRDRDHARILAAVLSSKTTRSKLAATEKSV
jgi:hypothetical protein